MAGPSREPSPDEKHEKATSGSTEESATNVQNGQIVLPKLFAYPQALLQDHRVNSTNYESPLLSYLPVPRHGHPVLNMNQRHESQNQMPYAYPMNIYQHTIPALPQGRFSGGPFTPMSSDVSATTPYANLDPRLAAGPAALPHSGHIAHANTNVQSVYLPGPVPTKSAEEAKKMGRTRRRSGWNLYCHKNAGSVKDMSAGWRSLSFEEREQWNQRAFDEDPGRSACLSAGQPNENAPKELVTTESKPKRKRATCEGGPSTAGGEAESQWKRSRTLVHGSHFSGIASAESSQTLPTWLPHFMYDVDQQATNRVEPGHYDDTVQSRLQATDGSTTTSSLPTVLSDSLQGSLGQLSTPESVYWGVNGLTSLQDFERLGGSTSRAKAPGPSDALAADPSVSSDSLDVPSDSLDVSNTGCDVGPWDTDFSEALELLFGPQHVANPSGEDVVDVSRTPATEISDSPATDIFDSPEACDTPATETSDALAAVNTSADPPEPYATSVTAVSIISEAMDGSNTSDSASNLREEYGFESGIRLILLPSSRQLISQMLADSMTIHPLVTRVSSYSSLSDALRDD